MDPYQRGRSPSAGHPNAIGRSPSPSPNSAFTSQANAFGYDPLLLGPANDTTQSNNTSPFDDSLAAQQAFQQSSFNPHYSHQDYQSHQQLSHQQHTTANTTTTATNNNGNNNHGSNNPAAAASFAFMSHAGNAHQSSYNGTYLSQDRQTQPQSFVSFDDPGDDLNQEFDSSIYVDFDSSAVEPQVATSPHSVHSNNNSMATHQQSPEPPHLLQPDMRNSAGSSPQASPAFYHDGFNAAPNSRPTSLSPSSAVFFTSNNDFSGASFQNHRRIPSDQHSDVSSTHASPYLPNSDGFENQPSPMLNAAADTSSIGPENLGFNHFTLSEPQHISPGHSSNHSPSLAPQQQQQQQQQQNVPLFPTAEGLGMMGMGDQFSAMQQVDGYNAAEMFPSLSQADSQTDMGLASQMSPPEITFDPAPPSKQPSFNEANPAERAGGALSPPDRSPNSSRQRSRSDPYAVRGTSRDNSPARVRSPSEGGLHPTDTLSVHGVRSRGTSPSGPAGGIQKTYRRLSSPTAPNMDAGHMLEQAERSYSPQPPAGNTGRAVSPTPSNVSNEAGPSATSLGGGGRRPQKHPATFSCTLCTKRFTRAYNLRSHLRTHTDERPFVCNVCGKAFARQHDRKRHEGLHSGERKFICRGTLSAPNSGTWGCGRRFARADALGRHFRSEAGRSCIRPLLDEEARERREAALMMDQANQELMMQNSAQQQMMQQPPMQAGAVDFGGMALPAALLQQYPALAEIQWNAPPAAPRRGNGNGGDASGASDFDESDYGVSDYGENEDWDYSARNSFSASNTSDVGFEEEDTGYMSGSAVDPRFAQAGGPWAMSGGPSNGYYSDNGGR